MTALHPIFTAIFAAHFPEPAEPESAYEHRAIQCPNCSRTELKTCSHPRCNRYACADHLTQCECSKYFCDEHITEYAGMMLCNAVCLAGEAEMANA